MFWGDFKQMYLRIVNIGAKKKLEIYFFLDSYNYQLSEKVYKLAGVK